MNKWCFFYTAFGLILYTPQLAAAARNKYGIGVRKIEAIVLFFLESFYSILDFNLSSCGCIM
jgi:hypothetical protein